MGRKNVLVVGMVALSVFVLTLANAKADDWQVVYQTDFSSDPGWTISDGDSDLMYWDQPTGRYHLKSWDGGNQYTHVGVPYSSALSYRLEYDIEVTHVDWAGDVRFGLGDPDMNVHEPVTWRANYSRGDGGRGADTLYYSDTSSGGLGTPYEFIYDLSVGYHNVLTYDTGTQTLSWLVTRISDGVIVANQSSSGIGTFTGMDRLYSGSVGDNYAPGAAGEGYIDNVTLSVLPEPLTLSLLGIGGLALLRRRR